jgi:hypothetical protein
MNEQKSLKSPQRREFFKKAGLGAGAAVVAAGSLGPAAEPAAASAPAKSQGYRETDHVKRVYELSKF